ncbi:MAG TPA: DUF3426 domain-containing protein [Herbaspirillum sp.]|nr:DUF3426 domain-containing protein [Herbaspirillum sp.]
MAQATQCPFCQTTFRVVNDQLKLRGGLVRCGHCNEVFDGNAHLLPDQPDQPNSGNWPQQTPLTPPPITPAIARANAAAPNYGAPTPPVLPDADAMVEIEAAWDLPPSPDEGSADTAVENTDADDALMIEGDIEDESENRFDNPEPDRRTDADIPPLPLLLHPSRTQHGDDDGNEVPAEHSARIEPGSGEWSDEYKNEYVSNHAEAFDNVDTPVEQLDFVLAAQRRQRRARTRRLLMIVVCVLLVITALAQGVYLGRNQIAAAVPSLKPLLIAACQPLRCTIGLQKQIDQLSIESNELQAATPDQPTLTMNLLLRNRAAIALAWPDIELTLNDDDEKALIRRVFTPAEYLPSVQLIDAGIAADAEQTIKLSFTVTQGTASGYRVYLFYP